MPAKSIRATGLHRRSRNECTRYPHEHRSLQNDARADMTPTPQTAVRIEPQTARNHRAPHRTFCNIPLYPNLSRAFHRPDFAPRLPPMQGKRSQPSGIASSTRQRIIAHGRLAYRRNLRKRRSDETPDNHTRSANLYPTRHTVSRYFGCDGLSSIFSRILRMNTVMLFLSTLLSRPQMCS